MKKDILLHYIFVQPNITTFSSQNKKRVIVENETNYELDFRDKCINVIESFNSYCTKNSNKFYHLFLPINEVSTRPADIFYDDPYNGITQIMLYNFTNENFNSYAKKYRELLKEINNEDMFELFDIWLRKNEEQYSHIHFTPLRVQLRAEPKRI